MYQHLTECKTQTENMKISFWFCKICLCLKILENIQISVNMIGRLDCISSWSLLIFLLWYYWWILSEMWFYLEYNYVYWCSVKYFIRKILKCNVWWFYLFGQGIPNETKGMINLKCPSAVPDGESRGRSRCRPNTTYWNSSTYHGANIPVRIHLITKPWMAHPI